jgi:hypothetical protein
MSALIGTATLNGQSYELHRLEQYDWLIRGGGGFGPYATPAEAVDALWNYLSCRVAPEGWWQPAEGVTVDISAAKHPRTVSEREQRLGQELSRQLKEVGLQVTAYRGRGEAGLDLALAYQLAEALVLEVRAEELLEQLAVEHEIECELVEMRDTAQRWWIVDSEPDPDGQDFGPLATGTAPLEAVEELRRDLETPGLAEYSDAQLLQELLDRAKGRAG